jgi:hypothetical protein
MEMPWNSVIAGMAQPGAMTVEGVTSPLDTSVVVMGDEMCSTQHAMGPLPVACACTMKPVNASCMCVHTAHPTATESVQVCTRISRHCSDERHIFIRATQGFKADAHGAERSTS